MTPVALVQHRDRQQLSQLPIADAQRKLIQMWLHGKTESTVKAYQHYITKFLAFLGKPLKAVTLEDLYDFAESLVELAPNSQKIYLSAVKSLLSFAHKIGYIPFNVGSALKLKKTADTLNERLLSENEIQKMIWATEEAEYRYGKQKQRDLLILRLIYVAGMRVSELVELTWFDVTPRGERGQITVTGKGEKTRTILLPQNIWADLIAFRGKAPDKAPLFPSRGGGKGKAPSGGHLDRTQINRIISAATLRAKINKKVSPHWLRHAHATHALEKGMNIGLVQKTLGHDNVSTTSRYLHARPDDSSALCFVNI
jgi:integrase/recombinase XerD